MTVKYEVFVINMLSRKDRWKEIRKHFKDQSEIFELIRYPALRGTPGWKYCALSHLSLIRRARDEGREFIIVMEDDNIIRKEQDGKRDGKQSKFDKRFERVITSLLSNDEWDIFNGSPSWCTKQKNQSVTRLIKEPVGPVGPGSTRPEGKALIRYEYGQVTNFMIYRKSSYDKILSLESQYLEPNLSLDYEANAFDQLLCTLGLRLVTYLPYLFIQRNGWSDIMARKTDYQRGILDEGEGFLRKSLLKQDD